ncbi:MAG TPA: trehalose-phosphatase, partial [Ktedonobacterales bacterium]
MAHAERDDGTPMIAFPRIDGRGLARVQNALTAHPRGLFTDVDGTLSRIAPSPEAATLLPGVAELLEQARAHFDVVAAVSGRSALDAARLVGMRDIIYIGNHGLERLIPQQDGQLALAIVPEAEPYVAEVLAALENIEETLGPRIPGLLVEHKGVTGSIHVRRTEDPSAAEEAVMRELARRGTAGALRVTRGKMVVEVRPPIAVDKGVAVATLIEERGLRGALYLGDDRTDIDAFRALRRLTELGVCACTSVAVLHTDSPPGLAQEADVALDSIERVPEFLRWLLQQE